ncbi:MAG TPA: 16S rRNA (guanine(527)-N(7))-methyltransferase RsmG [Methylomirabilota bacterium]|nr:16S rRNA (guanine(527)-N(7))-methyltransferase RsmG [Methylomirabilota bacterium]
MFGKYLELLIKWGSVYRMIGSIDPEWIVENLFLDSLLFLGVLPMEARSILDFGAGAGLPGIPIAIVRPSGEMALLEAKRRRATFLSTTIRELGLSGARVLSGRAEDLVQELGGAFDAVVMRCAGRFDEVLPLAARFIRAGGIVVASGPEKPGSLRAGEWRTVPAVREGSLRRFAVLQKSSGP